MGGVLGTVTAVCPGWWRLKHMVAVVSEAALQPWLSMEKSFAAGLGLGLTLVKLLLHQAA